MLCAAIEPNLTLLLNKIVFLYLLNICTACFIIFPMIVHTSASCELIKLESREQRCSWSRGISSIQCFLMPIRNVGTDARLIPRNRNSSLSTRAMQIQKEQTCLFIEKINRRNSHLKLPFQFACKLHCLSLWKCIDFSGFSG